MSAVVAQPSRPSPPGHRRISIFRQFMKFVSGMTFAVANVLLTATPASAAETGWAGATGATGCTVGNMADNLTNTYYRYNLEADANSAVSWTVQYIENETLVDEVSLSAQDSNTDVIYNDGDYSVNSGPPCVGNSSWYPKGSKIGYTACWSTTSWGGCQQHRVYLATPWLNEKSNGWDQALTLHESGHALGLVHPRDVWGNEVNVSGEVMSPSVPLINYFTQRDKDLINAFDTRAH